MLKMSEFTLIVQHGRAFGLLLCEREIVFLGSSLHFLVWNIFGISVQKKLLRRSLDLDRESPS
jgi:hypothetical protein